MKNRKKHLFLVLILFWGNFSLWSQTKYEVELAAGWTKELGMYIVSDLDGKELFILPVSLHLTDKGNLIMMLGNGNPLGKEQSLWLFSSQKNLKWLMANNKNVSATKEFQNRFFELNIFFNTLSNNVQLFSGHKFDNDYEVVSGSPKPVIFQVKPETKEMTLFLTFYVSKPDKKCSSMLFTKAKIIELKIKVK